MKYDGKKKFLTFNEDIHYLFSRIIRIFIFFSFNNKIIFNKISVFWEWVFILTMIYDEEKCVQVLKNDFVKTDLFFLFGVSGLQKRLHDVCPTIVGSCTRYLCWPWSDLIFRWPRLTDLGLWPRVSFFDLSLVNQG